MGEVEVVEGSLSGGGRGGEVGGGNGGVVGGREVTDVGGVDGVCDGAVWGGGGGGKGCEEDGEGGALPGGIVVPAFNDAKWQDNMTNKQMARSIALGKGAMPSFMNDLDRDKLAAVIAFVRTLKSSESGW